MPVPTMGNARTYHLVAYQEQGVEPAFIITAQAFEYFINQMDMMILMLILILFHLIRYYQ